LVIVMEINGVKVRLVQGDITEEDVDVIVNAANPSLMGGGGVDGAIHRAGGLKIRKECIEIRQRQFPDGLPTGEAVITSGGNLKAKYVIHTVGPIWMGGVEGEAMLLGDAYRNSLKVALENGLRSVAFPSISTGAYGYPIEKAVIVAVNSVKAFLEEDNSLYEVIFVLFSDRDHDVYMNTLQQILG
jgi:O-acetyl-ADP-ribose deacetylase (regulator of RNase III)